MRTEVEMLLFWPPPLVACQVNVWVHCASRLPHLQRPGASAILEDTAPLQYFKHRWKPNWVSHVPHLPLSPASLPPRARHPGVNIGLAMAGRYMGWCCPRKITIGQIIFRLRSTNTLLQLLLQPSKTENKKYREHPLCTPHHHCLCSQNI